MHVEHEHNLFIKRVSRVNPNITRTYLALTYDLFINKLVVSDSRVMLDFDTPKPEFIDSPFVMENELYSFQIHLPLASFHHQPY